MTLVKLQPYTISIRLYAFNAAYTNVEMDAGGSLYGFRIPKLK